jgi:hypothetical protein
MQIRKKSQIIPFFRYYTTLKRPWRLYQKTLRFDKHCKVAVWKN